MTAVIHGGDPARVRSALVDGLQDLAIEVISSADRIILHGLGPGSVSVNYDDFAILMITEKSGAVFLQVIGAFDGSYLEDQAAQESEVQSKLARVFDGVQSQIDMEDVRKMETPVAAEPELPVKIIVEPDAMQTVEAIPTAVQGLEDDGLLEAGQSRHDVHAVREEVPMHRAGKFASAGLWRFGLIAAAFAGLVVVVIGVGGIPRHVSTRKSGDAATMGEGSAKGAERLGAIAPAASPSPDMQAEGKKVGDAATIQTGGAVAQLQAHAGDPTILLRDWEAAMRTRNAAEQSSFYSDPVELYEGAADVNWATLEQKKEAAIASRRGLWTMKLEEIKIEKRTGDEAQISVIQHVIDQPAPSQISEQFVRTELGLRRMNGGWRIVSEEDVAVSPDPPGPRS